MSVAIQKQDTKTTEEIALDRELAATFSSTDASDRWLRTPNPILNGDQPIECMKRREYGRVHAALEAFNIGVYV
jgi:Antitoxin Xre/MbcA/ParS C-terminal toxin-binding domain